MKKTVLYLFILSILFGISISTIIKHKNERNSIQQSQNLRSPIKDHTDLSIDPLVINQPFDKESSPDSFQEQYSIVYQQNPNLDYLNVNKDYMGWISIDGTQIDYPIVRGQDNAYYLDHDFYKKENKYGAIFMDYRNLGNFIDEHTIIYGHTLKDTKMFGDLNKYLNEDFLKEHPFITLEGLYETNEYEIISVYEEKASDIEIELHIVDESYIEKLMDLSLFQIETSIKKGKLLTLATCTYSIDDGRLIVHAIER